MTDAIDCGSGWPFWRRDGTLDRLPGSQTPVPSGCCESIKIPTCLVQSMPFALSDSEQEMQIANRG